MRAGCASCCCIFDAVLSLPEPASHQHTGAARGLLSWSPPALLYQLKQLSDELQNGGFFFSEENQNKAQLESALFDLDYCG